MQDDQLLAVKSIKLCYDLFLSKSMQKLMYGIYDEI